MKVERYSLQSGHLKYRVRDGFYTIGYFASEKEAHNAATCFANLVKDDKYLWFAIQKNRIKASHAR